MTGAEIRRATEIYVGKSIEADMALIGINEAMQKIGDMGLLYGEVTISDAKAGKSYLLPKNFIHVFYITDKEGAPYSGYTLMGNKIIFKDEGSYVVYARRLAERLESLDEEPEIHQAYHSSLVEYLRRFVLEATSKEPQNKIGYYESFERNVLGVYQMLSRRRVPKQIEVIRHA